MNRATVLRNFGFIVEVCTKLLITACLPTLACYECFERFVDLTDAICAAICFLEAGLSLLTPSTTQPLQLALRSVEERHKLPAALAGTASLHSWSGC